MNRPRGPKTFEDYVLLIVAAGLILIILWFLTACAAQSKQVKVKYKYTTTCEWQVLGAESQSGQDVGTGAKVTGDDCLIGRDSHAESEGVKKTPVRGEQDGGNQK